VFRLINRVNNEIVAGVAQSVQGLGHELDDRGSLLDRVSDGVCSLRHCIQTGSGDYPVGVGSSFSGSEVAGALSRPLTSN